MMVTPNLPLELITIKPNRFDILIMFTTIVCVVILSYFVPFLIFKKLRGIFRVELKSQSPRSFPKIFKAPKKLVI